MKSLKIIVAVPLMAVSVLYASAQNRVSVLGGTLGSNCAEFIKALNSHGLKVETERKGENDFFYGACLEVFLKGEVDRCPAVIHVKASQNTRTVFDVELILREFIDTEEASQEAERVMADICAVNHIAVFDEELFERDKKNLASGISPSVTFIEMPSGEKHITKYMCYPETLDMVFRFYETEEKVAAKDFYGSAIVSIYKNSLHDEHLVRVRYYDLNAGNKASAEAEKK